MSGSKIFAFLKEIVVGISIIVMIRINLEQAVEKRRGRCRVWGMGKVFHNLSAHLSTVHEETITRGGPSRTCPELNCSHVLSSQQILRKMKCVYSYPWVITSYILCSFPFEILIKEKKIGYNNMGDYSLCVKSLNNASEIH